MKKLITLLLVFTMLYTCKQDAKKEIIVPEKELTTAQKIAKAHGIDE